MKKILVCVLTLLLTINFLVFPKEARAGSSGNYPPSVNINVSTYDLSPDGQSQPKLTVYWSSADNVVDFVKPNGGTIEDIKNNSWWQIVVYKTNSDFSQRLNIAWEPNRNPDYETTHLDTSGSTIQWGTSYQAVVALYYKNPLNGQVTMLGSNTANAAIGAEPTASSASCTGQYAVKDLNTQVETRYGETARLHIVFNWAPGTPSQYQHAKIARPDGSIVGQSSWQADSSRNNIYDDSPAAGTYTVTTVDADGKNAQGTCTVKVSLSTQDTAAPGGKTDENGNNPSAPAGPGGPGAAGGECYDKCKTSFWGRFTPGGVIKNAICDMQCTVIGWMATLISTVIRSVLFPALGI